MSLLPVKKFGEEGLKLSLLGIGTTWFGRPWPPGNPSYTYPDSKEINDYLNKIFATMDNAEAMIMIDTSASYGLSEKRVGEYFRTKKELLSRAFIATKWGEEFNISTGVCTLNHSKKNLIVSVKKSLSCLGKIDLLYIHRTSIEVLKDHEVIDEMKKIKKHHYGHINYIGASFSNEGIWETAVKENLIGWLDAIQMPASVFLKAPDLIDKLPRKDIAIILNSPIRRGNNRPPKNIYADLLQHSEISVILTGTRHHLKETIGYFCKS